MLFVVADQQQQRVDVVLVVFVQIASAEQDVERGGRVVVLVPVPDRVRGHTAHSPRTSRTYLMAIDRVARRHFRNTPGPTWKCLQRARMFAVLSLRVPRRIAEPRARLPRTRPRS